MAVTPANQTFRKAVLPVLSELNIHLNLPDQSLLAGESGGAAVVNFNFNNPTFFVDGESTLLEDVSGTERASVVFSASPTKDQPYQLPPQIPSFTSNLLYAIQMAGSKGRKWKPGLGVSSLSNIISPDNDSVIGSSVIRYNYQLFLIIAAVGGPATVSGSSFHKFKFISANPANPQTLVYDIVA